jgi:hypothetical protein
MLLQFLLRRLLKCHLKKIQSPQDEGNKLLDSVGKKTIILHGIKTSDDHHFNLRQVKKTQRQHHIYKYSTLFIKFY